MKKNKEPRVSSITDSEREEIKEYVRQKPTLQYDAFMEETNRKYKLSRANYHYLKYSSKEKATRKQNHASQTSRVFTVSWRHRSEAVSEEAKNLLLNFISTLNLNARARFDLIEVCVPENENDKTVWNKYLEVREF
jgi:hypothetical protein